MIRPDIPERALSIRQPWAWAIINGGKDIENRSKPTKVRGRIAIHASLYRNADDDYASNAIWMRTLGITLPPFNSYARGGIVGTVEIADCVTASDSPWFFGKFGYVLRDPQPVDFISVPGALGFFKWRDRLEVTT